MRTVDAKDFIHEIAKKVTKIEFKNTAYTSIGFNTSYTGRFIEVSKDHFKEDDKGEVITIQLPERWTTVGRILIGS